VAFDAEAIILAMPTHECSRLLSSLHPTLGGLLGETPYSSSMTVSLGYAEGTREHLPPGFGYLVPRKESRRMLACTFVHRKFDHRAPEGKALLRCFLGGARDPEVLNLPDREVVSLVRQELKEILNFSFEPLLCQIHRWPASMAQYPVGHAERVRRIQSQLEDLPGIYLAGNAYSGIGISDCIRTGRAAAQRALGRIMSK
jgi:oxygen-dependent protoporphyrinogen oxidase